MVNRTAEARFWAKVNKTETCWLWTGALFRCGRYGAVRWEGKTQRAHRVSWALAGYDIPPGMELDHLCHVRQCVNPAHLRAATRKENVENHQGALRTSKSGVRGVSQILGGRWRAEVRHNGRRIHIGYYATLAGAGEAVRAKRIELWTHNDKDRM